MKLTLEIITGLCLATFVLKGQQVISEYDWRQLPPEKLGSNSGSVVEVDGKTVLKITGTNTVGSTQRALTIEHPTISQPRYAITGEVKYEGVEGDGYLEMLNYFDAQGVGGKPAVYFSRTLGGSGAMQKLSGSSGWRAFTLPFDRTGASNAPGKLELNIVLPGRGIVYLGPLKLVQTSGSLDNLLATTTGAWWSDRQGGLIGGTAGAVLGCFAGFLGLLAGKGRSRFFVLLSMQVLTALGVLAGIAGLVAVFMRQPYGVWFVLLLLAVLLCGICPFRLSQYRKYYDQLELRRMSSMDAKV